MLPEAVDEAQLLASFWAGNCGSGWLSQLAAVRVSSASVFIKDANNDGVYLHRMLVGAKFTYPTTRWLPPGGHGTRGRSTPSGGSTGGVMMGQSESDVTPAGWTTGIT